MPAERLLVIDDSKEARDFLEDFLGHHGYTVLTASDGEEGLLRATNENPDLILVDMRMPEMTGLEVIAALNQRGWDAPIIFLTAHGSEDLVVQAFRLGVVDYIAKPYEPQAVLQAVERALHQLGLHKARDQSTEQLIQDNQTLRRRLQELNALNAIGRSVTSGLDVEQILTRAVEAATFMTRAEEGSLMLLDESTGGLVLRAAKKTTENAAQSLRNRIDDTLAERVVNTLEPILLTAEGSKEVSYHPPVKALLMVPVNTTDRGASGVLAVRNAVREQAFSEHDLQMLSTIADYAGVAIANASLLANLQTEKSRLESVLYETGDGLLVADEQGRVLLCSQAAARAFQLDDVHVVGRPIGDIIRNHELTDLFARSRDSSPLKCEVPLEEGRTLDVRISAVAGVGYAMVLHDITPFKELDRVKSDFIATFSHDLRTPLTAVQGYVDLLPLVGPLDEQQLDFISRVQRSLAAINHLVSSFVDSSRVEAGTGINMAMTELRPIITEAVVQLRPKAEVKNQSLQVHFPANLSPIKGDHDRLCQAVQNLLSNAVNYTPSGGNIQVDVSAGDDHIAVRVADDGLGISVEDQPYVFDQFFRSDAPRIREVTGAGLGLSIVKSVVEKHGGRVWVESVLGEGSTFTFLLPKA